MVRRHAHRALQGAHQAARLLRRRQHRDAAGAGHHGSGRRRGDRHRAATGNLLAGIGYSSADKLVFNASVSQQNIFGSGNALVAGINTSRSTATISVTFSRAVLDGRRRVAHCWRSTSATWTPIQRRCRSRSTVVHGGRRGRVRHPDLRDRHRSISASASSTRIARPVREQPASAYRLYVEEFGRRAPTASSSASAGRVTRATTSSILLAGSLQGLVEVGTPIADLQYYKANYLQQWFLPVYGDFVLMLRGDVGYADGYSGKPLPFFKAFYAGGVGSVRGYEPELARSAGRLRQHDWRQAQDHRQRGAVLSDHQGREGGADQRLRRCRPDLPRRQGTGGAGSSTTCRGSATRPAWGSPGIRRSGR